jgi:hypothetical protein
MNTGSIAAIVLAEAAEARRHRVDLGRAMKSAAAAVSVLCSSSIELSRQEKNLGRNEGRTMTEGSRLAPFPN